MASSPLYLSALDIVRQIRGKKLSSVETTKAVLDRIDATQKTLNAFITVDRDGALAQANYVVLQVLFDRPDATLHQVGTYYDKFRRTDDGLKLAERQCVYSNLLVPNALCLPV